MTGFDGVVPALGEALSKREYTVLTPVQEAVLAPELKDADILVSAQTGSGKTVAFGLALAPTLLDGADRFGHNSAPLALVVAPTRELALQVKRELQWLYEETGANIASCVGGMDMRAERMALQRGAHIVVGTPGRLRDHIERGSLDTSAFRAIVLDEADEMLDLGFREDLEYILGAAPTDRRTLMFSATVPRSIASLAKRYQRDAVRVSTTDERTQHVDIKYRALTVAPNDRENAIINVLRYFDAKNALVFCGTRATVNRMTSRFANRGFSVVALSGELSQNERTHALQALRDGRAKVCIATDVAARGIDLPNLELVIHADLPKNRENLLHRSGRTGRAGRKGVCALIVPHNARRRTERLLQNANVTAEWARPPSADEILKRDHERILQDPNLSEDLTEDEQNFARKLLAKHDPDHIAAAFLRLRRSELSAPEELLDNAPIEREPRKRRDDFKNGVWFSISVGHKQNAEPRWLVPMLCRAGHLTKTDIGAIRVRDTESHVELAPGCVDKFLDAIGPGRKVEDNITITRLDGPPSGHSDAREKAPPGKPRERSYDKKRPYEKKEFEKKAFEKKPYEKKPYEARKSESSDRPADDRSAEDRSAKKPYEKKPFEKKKREPVSTATERRDDGSAPREKTAKRPYDKKPFEKKKPKARKPRTLKLAGDFTSKPGSKPARPHKKNRVADMPGFGPRKRAKPAKSRSPR